MVLAPALVVATITTNFPKEEKDMPDLGFVVQFIAISYALGVVWYTLLGRNYSSWMRMAAFPFVGAVVGESLVAAGPTFFGLHLYVVLVSTFAGAVTDLLLTWIQEQLPISKIGHQAVKLSQAVLGR